MIKIKSAQEIEYMKAAGVKLGKVFDLLKSHIVPGISTKELDALAYKYIKKQGCKPSFLGYEGFPGSICASVNETLIHGIPSEEIVLKDGDIISIDMGLIDKTHFQADACRTFMVGNCSDEVKRLVETTERCFYEAMKIVKPGIRVTDISAKIQEVAFSEGYSLVEEFGGHGIGKEMHEDPFIPNCGEKGHGPILQKNMCICIEPMVMQGKKEITISPFDGWTVKSKDRRLTCHYENTLVITQDGCEITTVDSSVISHLGGNKYETR